MAEQASMAVAEEGRQQRLALEQRLEEQRSAEQRRAEQQEVFRQLMRVHNASASSME